MRHDDDRVVALFLSGPSPAIFELVLGRACRRSPGQAITLLRPMKCTPPWSKLYQPPGAAPFAPKPS